MVWDVPYSISGIKYANYILSKTLIFLMAPYLAKTCTCCEGMGFFVGIELSDLYPYSWRVYLRALM
jgi:hypothetical protein